MTFVAVGMSGGVDSSVAAALLKTQGYEVTGVFIEAYNEPGCRADEDRADALKVATKLEIPFRVVDLRGEYKRDVIKYFFDEYRAGRTPNPDIVCNREIKFGLFYDWAMSQGFDFVATGHYARIKEGRVQSALDKGKDQSYFLWQVPRENLAKILWPLGEMRKKAVREKAHQLELPNAAKPDSMGVCMLGEIKVNDFLRQHLGQCEGEVVWKGQVVGRHEGLWFATIGQRGGWTIAPKLQQSVMPALYVIEKDAVNNRLVVGEHIEVYKHQFEITEARVPQDTNRLTVRIRNLGEEARVGQLEETEGGAWKVTTKTPLYAPAPGQSAVFYDSRGVVAGGGIIC